MYTYIYINIYNALKRVIPGFQDFPGFYDLCFVKQSGPLSEIRPSMLKRVCQEGPLKQNRKP